MKSLRIAGMMTLLAKRDLWQRKIAVAKATTAYIPVPIHPRLYFSRPPRPLSP